MKNLTRLIDREGKWYKIGPIPFPKGVPKRAPFYFSATLGASYLLSKIPYSPIWIINEAMDYGWGLTYITLPFFVTLALSNVKKAGKTPERYVMTMMRYATSPKHRTITQAIQESEVYTFTTVYTIRLQERKEETVHEASTVSDPAHRKELRVQQS